MYYHDFITRLLPNYIPSSKPFICRKRFGQIKCAMKLIFLCEDDELYELRAKLVALKELSEETEDSNETEFHFEGKAKLSYGMDNSGNQFKYHEFCQHGHDAKDFLTIMDRRQELHLVLNLSNEERKQLDISIAIDLNVDSQSPVKRNRISIGSHIFL